MATYGDVCTGALRRIGVLSAVETPSSEDINVTLGVLNQLLDAWATENLTIYTITRTTWTISSGTGTYSVGSGQTVNIARIVPTNLQTINFIDTSQDPDLEIPMGPLLTPDAYAAIQLKALTSDYPQYAYYNPTYPYGTITLWPVPTSSTLQGVVYAGTALTEASATSTSFALPPGYRRFLETNLAVEVAPLFGAIVPGDLQRAAAESKANVKRANIRLSDLAVEPGALPQRRLWGAWSIYSGP